MLIVESIVEEITDEPLIESVLGPQAEPQDMDAESDKEDEIGDNSTSPPTWNEASATIDKFISGPPLSVIAAVFIFIIFMTKQAKDLYERNQKHHRMENYNEFISDVSSAMSELETSVNKSSDALHQLMGVLRQHRPRRGHR
ncbi:hypothetical protein J6590_069843 [Homalodisca vitripennis]|nr:hypothetical protein J6590_069843 [Homalodisca vitripennis]